MIRKFKVTIGEKVYDVAVEEVGDEPAQRGLHQPIPAPTTHAKTDKHQPVQQPKKEKMEHEKGDVVVCPMPAKVVSIKCRTGERVRSGEILLVIEAMKMEHNIFAPKDGMVLDIRTAEGASVAYNQPLVIIG